MNLDNISNGNIVANFIRSGSGWSMKARGYYTAETYTEQDMYARIVDLLHNNFS